MKKKSILSFCAAGVLAAILAGSAVSAALPSSAAENHDSVRILAMGDSITDGYIDSNNGYRKYLCYNLQQQGMTSYDMVGPNCSWTDEVTYDNNGTTITYDPAHAGYSGYAIEEIGTRRGLYETAFENTYSTETGSGNMIEAYDPDIVLLQIGTNDVLDAYNDGITDRLEHLVDTILENLDSSSDMLFVASIPDIDVSLRYDWLNSYNSTYGLDYYTNPDGLTEKVQESIDSYNASVQDLVAKKQAEGKPVRFADIHSVVDLETGLYDGVHPNEDGYACMGTYWSEQILAYLNQTEPQVTEPAAETTQPSAEITAAQTESTTESSTTFAATVTSEETEETEPSAETTTLPAETSGTEQTEPLPDEPENDKGDITLDGSVDTADIVQLCRCLLYGDALSDEAYFQADLTEDGRVNGFDLTVLRQMLLQTEVQ